MPDYDRTQQFHKVFMAMAFNMASLSKDPNTKVGCILVSPNRAMVATGFNGFPAGYHETIEQWADRTSTDKLCKATLVRHAEDNALGNCATRPVGWTAYITHQPCIRCAGALYHAGIREVYWALPIKPEYHPELAAEFFAQTGVPLICAASSTTP